MKPVVPIVTAAVISVGALTLSAMTLANAEDTTSAPSATASSAPDEQGMRGPHGPGPGETLLTGEDAAKATAAAQAQFPDGTVLRVESDADGVYEAHVQKADGSMVIVQMDESFAVTGVQEMPAGGPRGPHGPGRGEAPLTGQDAQKATAAAQARFPNGTVVRVESDADGVFEAHVRKADGTEVVVQMDKSFQITGVQEMPDRAQFGSDDADESDDADTTQSSYQGA